MKASFILLPALCSSLALAATVDDFAANTGCRGTECTPYSNSRPELRVSYVNPNFSGAVIVTVNGIIYRGPAVYTSTLILQDSRHVKQLRHYDNNTVTAPDGSTLLLTLDVYCDSPLNTSGRNAPGTIYTVLGGTIIQP